jgi:hypothetical protein
MVMLNYNEHAVAIATVSVLKGTTLQKSSLAKCSYLKKHPIVKAYLNH